MRLLAFVLAIVVAVGLYFGSAIWTLTSLLGDARAGNATAVLARTDLPLLRRSLTDQVVQSYLRQGDAAKKLGPRERMLAATIGASVIDAKLAELLTDERLAELLRSNRLSLPGSDGPGIAFPRLADIGDAPLRLLTGIRIVQPVAVDFETEAAGDGVAAVTMHFANSHWSLAGIRLPAAIIDRIVRELPKP